MKCLLFVVNEPAFFLSHRLAVARAARESGYDVQIATGPGAACADIVREGFVHHALPLSRSGLNPISEARSFFALFRLFRSVRPDTVHLVTIKPVLYGGIAAKFSGVPAVICSISGLGTIFIATGGIASLLRIVVYLLYRIAFSNKRIKIIFQNPDDRRIFVDSRIIRASDTVIIKGSGVSLGDYHNEPETSEPLVVTMASRLLRDKGVVEYSLAARKLKPIYPNVIFKLAGDLDVGNRTSLQQADLDQMASDGSIEVLGHEANIAELFRQSNIVVLPSHREGLPKVLLEAAAAGRPVITTDVPGCRDAIVPDRTGLLVPVANPDALAAAIESLLLDPARRREMGSAGRRLAEAEFGIERVVNRHLELYAELTGPAAASQTP